MLRESKDIGTRLGESMAVRKPSPEEKAQNRNKRKQEKTAKTDIKRRSATPNRKKFSRETAFTVAQNGSFLVMIASGVWWGVNVFGWFPYERGAGAVMGVCTIICWCLNQSVEDMNK